MAFYLVLSLFLAGQSIATRCNADNCLRALQNRAPSASPFCSTYTNAIRTATTDFPAYATQCAYSPSRVSSACSCLVTPTPTSSCVPSTLQNIDFVTNQNGLPAPWVEIEHDGPGQTSFPYDQIVGSTYEARFPNQAISPSYSYLTLGQTLPTVCNAQYILSFEYASRINIPSSTPVTTNCTVTSGLREISNSVSLTPIPYQASTFSRSSYAFTISGLPAGGVSATVFFDTRCTNVEYYPVVILRTPLFYKSAP